MIDSSFSYLAHAVFSSLDVAVRSAKRIFSVQVNGAAQLVFCGVLVCAVPVRAERELSTDRPDVTESPFTVEPGRVQIEASFAEYTRDRHNPEREDICVTAWSLAPVNIRVGLTPCAEVQFIVDSFIDVKTVDRTAVTTDRVRGFGDVTVRAKWNFWGNDGGVTALGLMPFVKIPTARTGLGNHSVEGGLILPFAMDLAAGFSLGAMTEGDVVRNAVDDGYTLAWINTVTVGYALTANLSVFGEFTAKVGEGSPALGFDTGLTYAVNKDLQLDCGVNFGLTRAADDVVLFAGFTRRF